MNLSPVRSVIVKHSFTSCYSLVYNIYNTDDRLEIALNSDSEVTSVIKSVSTDIMTADSSIRN